MCTLRQTETRAGALAWLFLGRGNRYAALELDQDGDVVALLANRATGARADAWVVPLDGADEALRRIREFLAGAERRAA